MKESKSEIISLVLWYIKWVTQNNDKNKSLDKEQIKKAVEEKIRMNISNSDEILEKYDIIFEQAYNQFLDIQKCKNKEATDNFDIKETSRRLSDQIVKVREKIPEQLVIDTLKKKREQDRANEFNKRIKYKPIRNGKWLVDNMQGNPKKEEIGEDDEWEK